MAKYHLRRVDREIKDQELINMILVSATHMNLAMADGDEPYIVPLNYVYEPKQRVIYFHGAKEGKKMDILRKAPRVWGSAVVDHGFTDGQCENLYASVVFSGDVSFIEDQETKLMVLRMQIDKQSGDKEEMKRRLEAMASSGDTLFSNTEFCMIKIDSMTGKRSTLWTEERLRDILS